MVFVMSLTLHKKFLFTKLNSEQSDSLLVRRFLDLNRHWCQNNLTEPAELMF